MHKALVLLLSTATITNTAMAQPKKADYPKFEALVTPIYTGKTRPPQTYPPLYFEVYLKRLQEKAYAKWFPPEDAPGRQTVKFTITPEGEFQNLEILGPHGEIKADNACLEAVLGTSKFAKSPWLVDTTVELNFFKARALNHRRRLSPSPSALAPKSTR